MQDHAELVAEQDARLLALLFKRYPPPMRFDASSVMIDFNDEMLEAMQYLNIRRLKSKRALNRKAEASILAMLRRVRDRQSTHIIHFPHTAITSHWVMKDSIGWYSFTDAKVIRQINPAARRSGRKKVAV
jgi:hypothetical protein